MDTAIVIPIFFIILFFIYHVYYLYKPSYEGFTGGQSAFQEGFAASMNKQKTKMKIGEQSERMNNGLPNYQYKEDVPLDEKHKQPNNTIVNNASIVNYDEENRDTLANVEKNLEEGDFVFNKGNDVWTKFYCSIYDSLMLDNKKNKYELRQIYNITKMNEKSKVLDIGCGTGHHVDMLTRKGVPTIGIDSSIEMIKNAKYNFPKCKFYNSDVMHANQFQYGVFTHALMLHMTLYYIQDKTAAFHNIHTWLKPNGYMIIHLVNRDQYDPRIFASDPLYKVNPQRFSKKRITQSFVKFDDFQYKGDFIEKNENSTYVETMKEDEGDKAIRNEHVYYMEKQKTIIDKAKGIGFKFIGKINMSVCNHPYEYLYVFQKTN